MRGKVLKAGARYYAIYIQGGEGCDYTIGCGCRAEALAAMDPVQAHKEVERRLEDFSDEQQVEALIIHAADSVFADTESQRAAKERARIAEEEQATEARDRAEYERLRDKFEPGVYRR